MRAVFLLTFAALSLAGCSVECGAGTEEINNTCLPVVVEDTAAAAATPVILTYTSNVATLDAGETLILTAVVTHPEGVENIIGGQLLSGSGASYGAFTTGAGESTYEIDVTWWEINQINPISLDAGADGSRPFKAVFYDTDGDSTNASVDVGLSCDGLASCDGVCGAPCGSGGSDSG